MTSAAEIGAWKTDGSSSPSTGGWTLGAFDLTVDTDLLFVDASANRIGFNTLLPSSTIEMVGDGFTLTPSGANTNPFVWFNDNGSNLRALIAVVRSGAGALCGASAVNDWCFRSAVGDILFSSDNGSTSILRLKSAGNRAEWKADLEIVEQVAPGVVGGDAVLYADSTSHALRLSNNGDAFDNVARVAAVFTTANSTSTSASLATLTGGTLTLAVGIYSCHAHGVLNETTSADGASMRINVDSGTATLRSASYEIEDNGTPTFTQATTSADTTGLTVTATSFSDGDQHFDGLLDVTATAVLSIQFAQQAHSTGTLTAYSGTYMRCDRLD